MPGPKILNHIYDAPLDSLLSYGDGKCSGPKGWPNYVQELGLTAEHIPGFIQMAQDDQLWSFFFEDPDDLDDEPAGAGALDPDIALWAPIHAWRALGQLRAAEAVKPLAQVLQQRDIDWCWEELPDVFGLIGAEAIDPLDELLSADDIDYKSKVTLSSGLTYIAQTFPDQRDRCVEVLTRQLSHYDNHHISVNGALVLALFKLKAIESTAVMAAAYNAKKVDEMFVGSWPRIQVDLGLKQASDFTPEELSIHYTPEQEKLMANIRAYVNRHKPSAAELGLPIKREAFGSDKSTEFKDIAAQSGSQKLPSKSGFGDGAKASRKKGKKKQR
ncbi:hypothetical protein IQ254_21665 [Nodosilinea sp. LEGE 07088]|uniref:hypothetical protein n=1 Tax=Nodosilinea sp. LEGE 07088 TaxID=2777968 RepID=UPI00187ECF34|nr:hypothetical protein [Nodosilinea sp. LEGE 07088]MBE9139771.1 hypothetical protein [Nodosilinea sp. LEGE 07088]